MRIPIKTTKQKFHRQILEVLKALPPINRLRPQELEILAEIMYLYDLNNDVPRNKRKHVVFSTESRRAMQEKFGLSTPSINNILTVLRKHKILSKDNDLMPFLVMPYQDKFTIEIELYE